MTLLSMIAMNAPYSYVASERIIADVSRLLGAGWEAEGTSITLSVMSRKGARSILELEGLGMEIWGGVDPHKYIDDLRNEWIDR